MAREPELTFDEIAEIYKVGTDKFYHQNIVILDMSLPTFMRILKVRRGNGKNIRKLREALHIVQNGGFNELGCYRLLMTKLYSFDKTKSMFEWQDIIAFIKEHHLFTRTV